MRRNSLHIVLLVFMVNIGFAQKTFVPDTNLRKVLKQSYYMYLDANDYIVDASAATYAGFLNCSVSKVKDLTGAWKFTALVSLICHENEISNIDSIAKFPNLVSLYCYHNKITQLPDLSSLSKLTYLSCGNNQIAPMIDLKNNVPLTYLDCGNNLLRDIKGIDKLVNLQTLYLYNNQLDSIPDLSNLSKLQMLMCQYNNLKTIPGLSKLTQLTQLTAGNNPLVTLPDLKPLSKLTTLRLYSCQLNTMPDVSTMKSLSQLQLGNNSISQVPDFTNNNQLSLVELNNNLISRFPNLSASKATLKILKISSNQLDSLPDFSTYTNLDTLFVQNNRLTFKDILPIAQNTSITNVKYAPQAMVGNVQVLLATERQACSLVLGVDNDVSGNQYTWYRNGQWLGTTSSDTLLIQSVQLSDSGTYTCQVRNSLAPLLVLESKGITLKVAPCIDLSKLSYTTTDYDCNMGGSVTLNVSNVSGGVKPYTYKLTGNELSGMSFPSGTTFTNLYESAYTLEVKDNTGCKVIYSNPIALKGKKGPDCKHLIIIGDESSPNNTLYMEDKGIANVYDSEGQLVQTFTTPSTWDGKNEKGLFIPGYYIIELNGKSFNVTLIK